MPRGDKSAREFLSVSPLKREAERESRTYVGVLARKDIGNAFVSRDAREREREREREAMADGRSIPVLDRGRNDARLIIISGAHSLRATV